MLLVILCVAVSALLYVRGRWVERMRREEQNRQQQANGVAPQGQAPGAQPPVGLYPRPDNAPPP